MPRIKTIEYVADFETTSIRKYKTVKFRGKDITLFDKENSEAFVCAWAMTSVKDDGRGVLTGRTIEDFLNKCFMLKRTLKDYQTMNIFTHNLKFDGQFILYYILTTGYAKLDNEVRDDQWYSFTIEKDGQQITFRDSSKIFTCSVETLGELYGVKKLIGDWDYNKYRDENTPISDEEWEYVKHDVLIVAKALRDYREKGYRQNTAASIAYNQRLETTYPWFKKGMVSKYRNTEYEKFREAFPDDIMPLTENIQFELINAYFGGWTWLNPHYAEKMLRNISSFDENSMYPDKMANWVLPVGQCNVYNNPTRRDLEDIKRFFPCIIYRIRNLSIKLKDEWSLPMLMFDTDYKTSVRCQGKVITCKNECVYLTDYDYQMMHNEYDVLYEKIDKVYAFAGKKGQYKKYVEYWMDVKAENTILKKRALKEGRIEDALNHEQMRSIAKLMINSPYGKDGTKMMRAAKTSFINEKGLLDSETTVEQATIEFYLPSAIFITAAARWNLYQALKIAEKSFIYSDTDSLKVTKVGAKNLYDAASKGIIEIDDAKLGAWKDEALYEKAKFVRQKTYATYEDGDWHYTVCGAPDDVKAAFDISKFKRGMVITVDDLHKAGKQGKLIPVSVKGGVILQETGFQIADMEDWAQATPDNLPINLFVKFMRGGYNNAN